MQEQTLHITIPSPELVEEFTPFNDDMQTATIRDLVRASIDEDVDLFCLTEKTGQKIIRVMDSDGIRQWASEDLDSLFGDVKRTAMAIQGFKRYLTALNEAKMASKTIREYANTVQTIIKRAIKQRGYGHLSNASKLVKQFTSAQKRIIKDLHIPDKKAPTFIS